MKAVHVATPPEVVAEIDRLAEQEGRKRSQMGVVLWREAIEARRAKRKRRAAEADAR